MKWILPLLCTATFAHADIPALQAGQAVSLEFDTRFATRGTRVKNLFVEPTLHNASGCHAVDDEIGIVKSVHEIPNPLKKDDKHLDVCAMSSMWEAEVQFRHCAFTFVLTTLCADGDPDNPTWNSRDDWTFGIRKLTGP